MTERRADDATREVSDWLKCEYMQDHVGEELEGVIANVTGFGFFVRLADLHIDGLVHISTLANDYYRFDPIGQRLIGESFGNTYRLGDSVKVKVLSVNLDDRQIDFEIVETSRKLRGAGKTAKKRATESKAKAKGKKAAANLGSKAVPMIEPTKRPDDGSGKQKDKTSKSAKSRKQKARAQAGKARAKKNK